MRFAVLECYQHRSLPAPDTFPIFPPHCFAQHINQSAIRLFIAPVHVLHHRTKIKNRSHKKGKRNPLLPCVLTCPSHKIVYIVEVVTTVLSILMPPVSHDIPTKYPHSTGEQKKYNNISIPPGETL